ncbi:von Willebrand RING finger domain-containing protein [Arthroderma uncinatum]|uniref:von Willebrand RING finger domain-containing protein n=1 Tax=Arthroderma uncinatum TaxID=74035 RepID=UPI00144A5C99|nr:von Willebrand RING finger domain-containing protein [Arthroderma uncinatum]KAF3483508.1 von Willebrand RING finger domain-containing protein [Arthroderma uncinatum]
MCSAPLGLDASRSGNVLDLEKISNLVRSVSIADTQTNRSGHTLATPWDNGSNRGGSVNQDYGSRSFNNRESREHSRRDSRDTSSHRERVERLTLGSRNEHLRHDSGTVGGQTASEYQLQEAHQSMTRRHDYDVQAMEADLSPRQGVSKNLIPAPIVTVRSEFPSLNRSRQQQPLTCLVTVEVPGGKWSPDPEQMRQTPGAAVSADDAQSLAVKPQTLPSPDPQKQARSLHESEEMLSAIAEDLRLRVDNWHGLEFSRFGKLKLHGTIRVGKDRSSWQELECYLFSEMLICVKEKKNGHSQSQSLFEEPVAQRSSPRYTLKGSILIKKHLKDLETVADELVLTLNLSVNELPSFHLRFSNQSQLDTWKRALRDLQNGGVTPHSEPEVETPAVEEDDYRNSKTTSKRESSGYSSSYGAGKSSNTAITDYTSPGREPMPLSTFHVPLDIVVVIPVSSSMQGLKISLLRDTLLFLVQNLGPRDRMGLVTFGSSGGGVPVVGMTSKTWNGWGKIFNSIRPVGQKSLRADVVEGANVAMDLLMQRKSYNPVSTILLISDSQTTDPESGDFVVSRAEAAKVGIHTFGLGLTHKPDVMIELSSRTKASYTYVKDWMMLRECIAGCLGALQSTSHQNVKLKLRLPEGSPARFVKISGAMHTTKRATGRDAEAVLGDLRFGDKREVLVQLAITPDTSAPEHVPQDPWESIVSGLEALGGPIDSDDQRVASIEEVPLIQADVTYGDILREGHLTHSPRPSLLAITMFPQHQKSKNVGRPISPPIPPHPSIVQRRMELLTSDMLMRSLTLVTRGQHDRAHHLLAETRSILKGLGKGGLPPLPPGAAPIPTPRHTLTPTLTPASEAHSPGTCSPHFPDSLDCRGSSHSSEAATITPVAAVDPAIISALDADLEAALEWITHPAVFSRDSRKAVLQAIGVISSQRGYTFRTPSESLWAERIPGVKRLTERSREWREVGDESLAEE